MIQLVKSSDCSDSVGFTTLYIYIYIYIYALDLNNLQLLICRKIHPKQTKFTDKRLSFGIIDAVIYILW